MAKIRQGGQWLSNHYQANDYYCEDEKVVGHWIGKAAEQMGLEGKTITGRDPNFLTLFDGRTPEADPLTPRVTAIKGFDFQCSAQKSVSVMALVAGDERLVEAHRSAVREAFRELEGLAAHQMGQGSAKHAHPTGKVCAAVFDHDSSRTLDPQLHTHFAIANFTIAPDGRRYALETKDMVAAVRYSGKAYQNALRRNVAALGYETQDRFDKGKLAGFEIAGVSDETCRLYSKRSGVIEEAAAAFRMAKGREPTTGERTVMARQTRDYKLTEITSAQVRAHQRGQLPDTALARLDGLKQQAIARGPIGRSSPEHELLHGVVEHLSERHSTLSAHQILAETMNRGMGTVHLEKVKLLLNKSPHLVKLGGEALMTEFSTPENLRQENCAIHFINRTQDQSEPIHFSFVPFAHASPGADGTWLSPEGHDVTEQREAVAALLQTKDQVFALHGLPGAGKTTALKEFHAGVTAAGFRHLALACSTGAVHELKEQGLPAQTVASFLLRPPSLDAQTVLTVDEWSQLSTRQLYGILAEAEKSGARVRLVGDTRQHTAVEAGDAARNMERHSKLRSVTLSQINRQRDPDYKAAVQEMSAGYFVSPERGDGLTPVEPVGLERLERKGWLHETPDYISEAAKKFLEQTDHGKNMRSLGVAPTHEEIAAFTQEVRAGLQKSGVLAGETVTRQVLLPYDRTTEQRRNASSYQIGDYLALVREIPLSGFSSQGLYRVTQIKPHVVTIEDERGQAMNFNPRRDGAKVEVGRLAEIHLQVGERIRFAANAPKDKIINGEMATIARFEQDHIVTTAGKKVPAHYRRIAHGYAATSHSAQGKTTDYAVAFGQSFDRKALLVGHSRARVETHTFFPDRGIFFSRAHRSTGDRPTARDAIEKLHRPVRNRHAERMAAVAKAVSIPVVAPPAPGKPSLAEQKRNQERLRQRDAPKHPEIVRAKVLRKKSQKNSTSPHPRKTTRLRKRKRF